MTMIARFFSKQSDLPPAAGTLPDASHPTAQAVIPLEAAAVPQEAESWSDRLRGVVGATWDAGTDVGGRYIGEAIDVAGTAGRSAIDAAGSVGRTAIDVGSMASRTALVVGADTVQRAGRGAGWAASNLGQAGAGIVEAVVVTTTASATRAASSVVDTAIVQPIKAARSLILTVLFTVCGSAVAIAVCGAVGMYFYHAGPSSTPVAQAAPPTIIVLPQAPQQAATLPVAPVAPVARPEIQPAVAQAAPIAPAPPAVAKPSQDATPAPQVKKPIAQKEGDKPRRTPDRVAPKQHPSSTIATADDRI